MYAAAGGKQARLEHKEWDYSKLGITRVSLHLPGPQLELQPG